jgi:hypothetical protein
MDSLHKRIVANARYEGWQTAGNWKKAFLDKCRENPEWQGEAEADTDDAGRYELFADIRCIPDGWRLKVEGPETETPNGDPWSYPVLVLEFLEVEITHPMPLNKRDAYMSLWWTMDATSCFHFRVYRAERYGPIQLWLDHGAAYSDLAR